MLKKGYPSKSKAKKMLHDGTVKGYKITDKQRKLFGALASGQKPKKG